MRADIRSAIIAQTVCAMLSKEGSKISLRSFMAVPPEAPVQDMDEQLRAAQQAQAALKPVLDAKERAEGKR